MKLVLARSFTNKRKWATKAGNSVGDFFHNSWKKNGYIILLTLYAWLNFWSIYFTCISIVAS